MTAISQDAFVDWKKHIVTRELFKKLEEDKKNFCDAWINGEFINDLVINAKLVGGVQAITLLLNFNPVTEEQEEEKTQNDN